MTDRDDFDPDLNPVLELASADQLEPILEFLARSNTYDLDKHPRYIANHPDHCAYADLIASELRKMGGHSLANYWRSSGPTYREVVGDIASRIDISVAKESTVRELEEAILVKTLEKTLDGMSADELEMLVESTQISGSEFKGQITAAALMTLYRAGGVYSWRLAIALVNVFTTVTAGSVLTLFGAAALGRAMAGFTGPVGWTVLAAWTAYDLAGPAYRITHVSVLYVAVLRRALSDPDLLELPEAS